MKIFRRVIATMISLVFVFLLAGCGGQLAEYRPITTVQDFGGRRIGVLVGWEADYLLTGRDDLTIRRYDTLSDLILALAYKQLDGVALDEDTANMVLSAVDGIHLFDEPIAYIGYCGIVGEKGEKYLNKYNTWIADFMKTDDYKVYEERNHSFDGVNYEYLDIAEAENPTDTITIGYVPIYYPCAFEGKNGYVTGFDIDIFRYFAKDMGYKLEFVPIAEAAIGESLKSVDIIVGGLTDVYKDDYEMIPGVNVCEPFRKTYIKVIEVSDWDSLEMKSAIEQ